MADVARVAGVSVTTVSHVVNGTRPASERTVRRVREAIERTGYSHNTIARALARARTQSLGLAISVGENPYFAELVRAVDAQARSAGHTVLVADTGDDAEQELRVVQALVERRVDGILLAPSAGARDAVLPYLARRSVPVVLLDRVADARLDQVAAAGEEPTARLVEHLAERGHRRIGFIAGRPGLSTTEERVAGYLLGLSRSGLVTEDGLIASGGSQRDGGREAAERLLALPDPPTALVSGNNVMTLGILEALRGLGLRSPEDVALACFDDFEWADLFSPRLTVIAQPVAELGRTAVELMLSRLDDPALEPRTIRLEPQLVHRESCGCPPAGVRPRRATRLRGRARRSQRQPPPS